MTTINDLIRDAESIMSIRVGFSYLGNRKKTTKHKPIVFFRYLLCDKANDPIFKVQPLSSLVRRMGLEPTRELTTSV
jgi:hypothetical protein